MLYLMTKLSKEKKMLLHTLLKVIVIFPLPLCVVCVFSGYSGSLCTGYNTHIISLFVQLSVCSVYVDRLQW